MVETVGKLRNLTQSTSTTMKRDALLEKFKAKISVNLALDRALVSFQANKNTPFYSWFKYKEGFSESLVTYLLQYLQRQPGVLLDPFSGASSSLFAASNLGWQTKASKFFLLVFTLPKRVL